MAITLSFAVCGVFSQGEKGGKGEQGVRGTDGPRVSES